MFLKFQIYTNYLGLQESIWLFSTNKNNVVRALALLLKGFSKGLYLNSGILELNEYKIFTVHNLSKQLLKYVQYDGVYNDIILSLVVSLFRSHFLINAIGIIPPIR